MPGEDLASVQRAEIQRQKRRSLSGAVYNSHSALTMRAMRRSSLAKSSIADDCGAVDDGVRACWMSLFGHARDFHEFLVDGLGFGGHEGIL